MKKILRLGESYAQSTVKRHVVHALLISLYIILLPNSFVRAQSASVKDLGIPEGGLKIGDSIPEALWHLPLQVVNHPEGKDTITLNDYRGKLIILDFWGKYCVPCIKALPKIDSLTKPYKENVQAIGISDFETAQEYNTSTVIKRQISIGLNIPLILEAPTLSAYFPHRLVSHIVWINETGSVAAITDADHITKSNIADVLSGKSVNLPLKRDALSFDNGIPMLAFSQSFDTSPQYLYYSSLTTHIRGVGSGRVSVSDTTRHLYVLNIYNAGLLSLCQIAFGGSPIRDEDMVLYVNNRSRYIYDKSIPYEDWAVTNTYSFSLCLPINLDQNDKELIEKCEIKKWLLCMGIELSQEKGPDDKIFYTISERSISSAR